MNKNIKNTNRLLIAIIIGIICGVLLGGIWPEWGKAIYFLGEIFNSLKEWLSLAKEKNDNFCNE